MATWRPCRQMLAAEPALLDACFEQVNERPIQAAAHTGSRAIAEFLLENGAPLDIFAAASLGLTDKVAQFLADDPSLASANGVHGISILYHAALSGQVEIAELLKAHGGGQEAGRALHAPSSLDIWIWSNGCWRMAPTPIRLT
jgi:uncharacterized protein